jgi:hypothetical protein
MDLGFDVGDIAKTLGGLMAFVVVLYIGVLFYKKESSFSDEYVLLLKQYKERNDLLILEAEQERKEKEDIEREFNRKLSQLTEDNKRLADQLAYFKNLLNPPHPGP